MPSEKAGVATLDQVATPKIESYKLPYQIRTTRTRDKIPLSQKISQEQLCGELAAILFYLTIEPLDATERIWIWRAFAQTLRRYLDLKGDLR